MTAIIETEPVSQWDGLVEIAARAEGTGPTSYASLRSSGALAARANGEGVWLVGASAHPIGGDRLHISLNVGPGASLNVRSSSATLARAGVPPRESTMEIDAEVADGGTLCWCPQPGVAARGSRHRSSATIALQATSRLTWADAIVLGRRGEERGSWSSRIRVDVADCPLVVSDLALGPAFPAWSSCAVLGGARCVYNVLLVDPMRKAPAKGVTHPSAGYVVPVSAHAVQCVAWGATFREVRNAVRTLCAEALEVGWVCGALAQELVDN